MTTSPWGMSEFCHHSARNTLKLVSISLQKWCSAVYTVIPVWPSKPEQGRDHCLVLHAILLLVQPRGELLVWLPHHIAGSCWAHYYLKLLDLFSWISLSPCSCSNLFSGCIQLFKISLLKNLALCPSFSKFTWTQIMCYLSPHVTANLIKPPLKTLIKYIEVATEGSLGLEISLQVDITSIKRYY